MITGITGQDGAYLSEFLLNKGYNVHGIVRQTSLPNTTRLKALLGNKYNQLKLHSGDLTDSLSLQRILNAVKPDEIYNLGAQTHVKVSFDQPEYTANTDGIGALRLLEIIRNSDLKNSCRFYQASTSELFGKVQESPQTENTPFYPRSPYGIAKLYAYWTVINYREAYGLHASNGILFNHESPYRGDDFVSQKIVSTVVSIVRGEADKIVLGNLNAKRDWGHARDYVRGMWLMLQQDTPDDYILATGETHSVRYFLEMVFNYFGIQIEWHGQGIDQIGVNAKDSKALVSVSKKFFRPTEVDELIGDASKAKNVLGWEPNCNLDQLIKEMIEAELKRRS